MARTVFLLSPARCSGIRAGYLYNTRAGFDLAVRLRRSGVPLGEAFSFMSGLYFRGKLIYAETFARPEDVLVITPGRGLLPAHTMITLADLRAIGDVPVEVEDTRYLQPLARDTRRLAGRLRDDDRVVLLGSVATGKYVDVLLDVLGERLYFPLEFVGRGDMSRGGLMLRCVDIGREMTYVPLVGATRHGKRPPRLPRRVKYEHRGGRRKD